MRIAVVRLSALGDVIVSASFLPALKEKFGCEIDWFVDSRFGEILENSPYIDTLYKLPLKDSLRSLNAAGLMKIFKTIKNTPKYDIVFDAQGLLKSAILSKMLKSKAIVGFDRYSIKESLASFFYTQTLNIPYCENILKRNSAIFGVSDLQNRSSAFGFKSNQPLLKEFPKNILLVIEASKPQKIYPPELFIEVCKGIGEGIGIYVLYHSNFDGAKKIVQNSRATLLPKMNLDEVKHLVSQMDLVIGGDTGVTHLAWAMGRASITLYGNTPMARFSLDGAKNISLSGNLEANYKKDDFSIASISPKTIVDKVEEILS